MTGPSADRDPAAAAGAGAGAVGPWHGTAPELTITAVAVVAAAAAAAAVAGWPGLALVAIIAAAASVVVMRFLAPRAADQIVRRARDKPSARSISGYAQRRFTVATGISNRGFYEAELRPALEHLLAARLAERHGINLYTDPDRARAAFCQTAADEGLWSWIDPVQARQGPEATFTPQAPGIPQRTLARLVDRLENL
jgi:hypothetical protein